MPREQAVQVDEAFADAVRTHLDAIRDRDIEAFTATLDDAVITVAPGPAINRGIRAVRAAHAGWFASDSRWEFDATPLEFHESGNLGLVLLDVAYRETPGAEPSTFLLSLIFERKAAGWRLIFDQNTPSK